MSRDEVELGSASSTVESTAVGRITQARHDEIVVSTGNRVEIWSMPSKTCHARKLGVTRFICDVEHVAVIRCWEHLDTLDYLLVFTSAEVALLLQWAQTGHPLRLRECARVPLPRQTKLGRHATDSTARNPKVTNKLIFCVEFVDVDTREGRILWSVGPSHLGALRIKWGLNRVALEAFDLSEVFAAQAKCVGHWSITGVAFMRPGNGLGTTTCKKWAVALTHSSGEGDKLMHLTTIKFLIHDLPSSVVGNTSELVGPLECHLHLTNLHPTTSALLPLRCIAGHLRQFDISDSEWIVLAISNVGLLIIDPTTHCLKGKLRFTCPLPGKVVSVTPSSTALGSVLVCDSHGCVSRLELSNAEAVVHDSKTQGHVDTLVYSLRIESQGSLRRLQGGRLCIRSAWFLQLDTCEADCNKLLAKDAEDKLLLFDVSHRRDQSSISYDDSMYHMVSPNVQRMIGWQRNLYGAHTESRNLKLLAFEAQSNSPTSQEFDDEFLDIDIDVAGCTHMFPLFLDNSRANCTHIILSYGILVIVIFSNRNIYCSHVTLLTGAQNHTVVLNVDRDRVYEATLNGIDVETITIHACSDQDLLVLQATPREVRVIQTYGARASGKTGLLESWTATSLLSSDARATISHVSTAGSKAVIVHHRDNQARLNVLNWGLTGISSICGATISQQQISAVTAWFPERDVGTLHLALTTWGPMYFIVVMRLACRADGSYELQSLCKSTVSHGPVRSLALFPDSQPSVDAHTTCWKILAGTADGHAACLLLRLPTNLHIPMEPVLEMRQIVPLGYGEVRFLQLSVESYLHDEHKRIADNSVTVALVYCDSIACVLDFGHPISANKLISVDSSFAEWRLIQLDCRAREMAVMTRISSNPILRVARVSNAGRLKFGVFNLEEVLLSSTGRLSVKNTSLSQKRKAMSIGLVKHQLYRDEEFTSLDGSLWQQTLGTDLYDLADHGATFSLPAFIFATRVHELNTAQSDDVMILKHSHSSLQKCFSNIPSDEENLLPSRVNTQDLWRQVPNPKERFTDILLSGLAYESHSEKLSVRHSVVSVLRLLEKKSPSSVYSVLQVSAHGAVPFITFD